ncbi:ABC transporter ATP-binding protein [Microvirga antarctica]|uniref:ABC transporter ATP-binding protein n=1 Tax=Microvirga antarctica TaxID=2819233 RepID=UPI001B312B48|nr:ABC transporter ATP-binding protein [Microvirga antarctica]
MNVSPNTILASEGLRVSYGPIEVLKGVSFSVGNGSCLAVIGPNGAGKTTLFKVLTGEVASRAGTISFQGADVTKVPAHTRTSLGMGRTFQVSRVFLELTARENVIVAIESRRRNAGDYGAPWWRWRPARQVVEEADALLFALGIAHLRHASAASLSHGDKKRLELAETLALEPSILLLDEPTAGMAPGDRMQIVELIQTIRAERGVSVVMTEHDMDVIFNLADRVLVMNYGEVIAEGTVAEVRENPTVRAVYLGQDIYNAAH